MLTIGLAATTAQWSSAFRSYVRDHGQGVALEVVMDRAALTRALPKLDVLVIDDIMRLFAVQDIVEAQGRGIYVAGLFEEGAGMGREYLARLGTDQAFPASTPPGDLLNVLLQLEPRPPAGAERPGRGGRSVFVPPGRPRRALGLLIAWTKVSGGTGLTEAVVAAAEYLATRARVLVVEADELAPVLVSRLLRSPETGLPWAVSRSAQGLRALPEGLSGPRGDGTAPLGHFDAICGTPGSPQVIAAAPLERLLAEAVSEYDYVLVEASWLVALSGSRERFGATRAVLQRAGAVVVLASADPDGAAHLVRWKAAALACDVVAPAWAAFGRAGTSRYERGHLTALVQASTGRHPFAGFSFLPEDATVMRARWNAELVWKGPWARSVHELAERSVACAGTGGASVPAGKRPGVGGEREHTRDGLMVAL